MHLYTDNINTGFREIIQEFECNKSKVVKRNSRCGEVMMINEPVIITFYNPVERVMLNPFRDANPFFMLYEALWMLAGRRDVKPVAYYNSKMTEFSDDNTTLSGAYGYRWKSWRADPHGDVGPRGLGLNQLDEVASHLKANPTSRRVVLQMWDPDEDLVFADVSKDVCCNLCVCFFISDTVKDGIVVSKLDMTVFNRSNDLIWSVLASDFVTFSILQEYMAAKIGVGVGVYNQVSNNLHVYTERWKLDEWMKDYYSPDGSCSNEFYALTNLSHPLLPLVRNPEVFDQEVCEFVERHSKDAIGGVYREPFLANTAQPMCIAYHYVKRKQYKEARDVATCIYSVDWRTAAFQWIGKRAEKHKGS